ncbi:helix-turn-helix transcriptional regulator [Isoptericola peretonis]|uniref:helix-turn-helix transcriptional regulator n=1 Tax=Isoptericola peretonis TaxID=2918523 RepID=UPI003A521590
MSGTAGPPTTLVGRGPELSRLTSMLMAAAEGPARAVLVEGDAGVGKTALVESAIEAAVAGSPVPLTALRAPCLPLTTVSSPFLPLREAIRGSTSGGRAHARDDGGDGRHGELLEDAGTARLDEWLDRLEGLGRADRVVLFVDDLQWADSSTLDALLYLVAGARRGPRVLLATVRSGEDSPEQRVRRWLADVRRMPACTELRLASLDRVATAEQLAQLLGAPPHESLVEDVYARGHGNPYFTRLLADGLAADARHVPDSYSADLRDAVTVAWYRLGEQEREVAESLAVLGAPAQPDRVARVSGIGVGMVRKAAAAGERAGLLTAGRHGSLWFRHPLGAEVLEQSLDDARRHALHGACAAVAAEAVARAEDEPGGADVRDVVALADHAYRAGDTARAYLAAVRAADVVAERGGAAEQQRLLARALDLHPLVPGAPESRRALLERSRTAAKDAGLLEQELGSVDSLLDVVDPVVEPLVVARLLVRRMHLEFSTGRAFMNVADMREAVRLAGTQPRSGTYALALAELAHAATWHDVDGLEPRAAEALEIAREAGDDDALAYALAANAVVAVLAQDAEAGVAFGREGAAVAARARNWWAYWHCVLWECNAVETGSSTTYAEMLGAARERMVELGAPHPFVAAFCADEADSWLAVGEWRRCVEVLRVALGADPGPIADVKARLCAARLAALQGRADEAAAHLARAEERFGDLSIFVALPFDAVRAEVRLAAGDASGGFDAALRGLTGDGPAPTMTEWLVPLALRALADLAAQAPAEGRDDVVARVDRFREDYPHVVRDIGPSTPLLEAQIGGLEALAGAEAARARRADDGGLWVAAADALAAGELAWGAAYACRRGAEAYLDAGSRSPGVALLRRGLAAADRLQALPDLEALRDLAARARVPLEAPAEARVPDGVVPGITTRERDVLALVAVGRTYAEIADALTITEKTVSTHVSHLLAKSGARTRVELAGLVRRRP